MYPIASRSKKWTKILRSIWNEIQLTDLTSTYDSGDNDEYYDPTRGRSELKRQNKDIILICILNIGILL